MTDDDESIRGSLGIDVGEDYSIPDSVWSAALDAAFDPDTAVSDPALVPEMDDDGDIASDHVIIEHTTSDHHPADAHPGDHIVDDDLHLDDPHADDHGHGIDHDLGAHESGAHEPGDHDPHTDHASDHDWHG